jgi:hypothetical protein
MMSAHHLRQGTEKKELLRLSERWSRSSRGVLPSGLDLEDRPKRQVIPKIRLLSEERSRTLFPSNLDHGEGTCLESAVDLLIQRPS